MGENDDSFEMNPQLFRLFQLINREEVTSNDIPRLKRFKESFEKFDKMDIRLFDIFILLICGCTEVMRYEVEKEIPPTDRLSQNTISGDVYIITPVFKYETDKGVVIVGHDYGITNFSNKKFVCDYENMKLQWEDEKYYYSVDLKNPLLMSRYERKDIELSNPNGFISDYCPNQTFTLNNNGEFPSKYEGNKLKLLYALKSDQFTVTVTATTDDDKNNVIFIFNHETAKYSIIDKDGIAEYIYFTE